MNMLTKLKYLFEMLTLINALDNFEFIILLESGENIVIPEDVGVHTFKFIRQTFSVDA